MLTIENVSKVGTAFVCQGNWYNLPPGVAMPPIGSVVTGNVTQAPDNKGSMRLYLQNMQVAQLGSGVAAPKQSSGWSGNKGGYQRSAKPAYSGSNANANRGSYDTTAEQKLRFNACSIASSLSSTTNTDELLAAAAIIYNAIANGFGGESAPVAPELPAQYQQAPIMQQPAYVAPPAQVAPAAPPTVQPHPYVSYQQPHLATYNQNESPYK